MTTNKLLPPSHLVQYCGACVETPDDLVAAQNSMSHLHLRAARKDTTVQYTVQYMKRIKVTIRDWNDLPDSLISSAEMSDDCVSKPPGEVLSIWRVTSRPFRFRL